METKKFVNVFRESVLDLGRKPLIILFSLLLGLVLFGFSQLGQRVAVNFQTTTSNILWTIFASLIFLCCVSYFFAGLIGLTRRHNAKIFFSTGAKFFVRHFFVMLTIQLAFIIILNGSLYLFGLLMNSLKNYFVVSVSVFSTISLIIAFAVLVGVLIFFSYASIFLVLENRTFIGAIVHSFRFVKQEYLATLAMLVLFYVLFYFMNYIPGIFGDVILYGLLVPCFVLVLARIVKE